MTPSLVAKCLDAPSSRRCRTAALSLAALICLATLPALADPPDGRATSSAVLPSHPTITGSEILTDGMLTPRDVRRLRRASVAHKARATGDTSTIWLFDYMSRLLDTEPVAARRPRQTARVQVARASVPAVVATPRRVTTATPFVTTTRVEPPPAVLVPPVSTIVTGTVRPIPPAPPEAAEALIVAAEQWQARADLVKLEFSSRTYDERKMSGQRVFASRTDWHVLERAKDALTGPELAAATASGFEANAYINDITRTIVVAVAGTQDVRRDFLTADVWKALIRAQAPQQFYLAKTYVRTVIQRYQTRGYTTECIGHSLGGGACAYAASELGIRALVLNPISAGKLAPGARFLITNYVVDGDIASLVYGARGHEFPGSVQVINDGRDVIRLLALERYGQLAGPILVIRELRASIDNHKADHALDLIAAQAETERPR